MSLSVTGPEKDQLVAGLAALLCLDAGVDATADNLQLIMTASGNGSTPAYYSSLFATYIEKAGGVEKFLNIGGGGGGGGGAPAAAAAGGSAAAGEAAAPKEAAPKEEEVDALEGGMDMFGGGGGGGGDY